MRAIYLRKVEDNLHASLKSEAALAQQTIEVYVISILEKREEVVLKPAKKGK